MSPGPSLPTTAELTPARELPTRVARSTPLKKGAANSASAVRAIWEDYLSILVAHVSFAALTIAGLALAARLLGPESYGTVVLFTTVIQLLFIVGTKWSFPAMMRFGREALVRQGRAGGVLWAWSPLLLGAVAACSLGLLVGSRTIAGLVGPQSPPLGVYLAVFALTCLGMATVQLLQVQGRIKVAAWSPVIGKLTLVILLAWFSLRRDEPLTPVLVILAIAVGLAIQVLLSLGSVGKAVILPLAFDWSLTRAMMRYSLPLWVGFLAAYLSEWVDLYFLRFVRGHADVGVYQIAYQAFLFLAGGIAGLYTLLFPLLTAWRAEGREDSVRRYAVRVIPQVSLLWGLVVLVLGLVHEPCFSALFGPRFAQCSQPFALLLIGLAFQPVIVLYSTLFFTHDNPRQNARMVVIMATVNIFGDALLIPRWGMVGAAAATAASFAVAAWLCLSWGNRQLHLECRAALVPSLAAAAALSAMSGQGPIVRGLVLAGAALALIGWARSSRIFSRDDLSMWEQVRCPRWMAALIANIYTALSGRHTEGA